MTSVGQQTNYQKGDVFCYQGKTGRVIDTIKNGFITVEFNDGQQLSIQISSLSCVWNASSEIENLTTKIDKKEAYQDFCIDSYYSEGKNIKNFKNEIESILKGMDASELSSKMRDVYDGLQAKLAEAKDARRLFSGLIQRNAHALVSLIQDRGEMQKLAIFFNNIK